MALLIAGVVAVGVTGCATRPSRIPASFVDEAVYAGLDCGQLKAERQKVEQALWEASRRQNRRVKGDIASVALLGVPLASMVSDDPWEAISQLKGAQTTLRRLEAKNSCETRSAG